MKPVTLKVKKSLATLIGGALLVTALPGPLHADTTAAELQQLQQQLQELSLKIKELEARQQQQAQAITAAQTTAAQAPQAMVAQTAPDATATTSTATAATVAGSAPKGSAQGDFKIIAGSNGFGVASADGAYAFRFRGIVQFDNRLFFDDSTPASQNKFILRRLRPTFEGTLASIYNFRFTPELGGGDASSSSVSLMDAWFSATPYKGFGIKFGKFVSPTALEPGNDVSFVESSLVNNLLPNRDIGIEAFGSLFDDVLHYRAGVFNGARNNSSAFNQDINGGNKSFACRLTLNPFIKQADSDLKGLSFSLGSRYGFNSGGNNIALTNYRTPGQQTLLNWGALQAGGSSLQLNPAIEWYPGKPYSAVVEFALENQRILNPGNGQRFDIINTAWRVNAGYVLTGEARTPRGVKPDKPFDWGGSNWGALEFVARIGGIHLDIALFNPGDGNLSRNSNASGAITYGIGLNWYLTDNLLVRTNLQNTDFKDYNDRGNELNWFTRFQLSW